MENKSKTLRCEHINTIWSLRPRERINPEMSDNVLEGAHTQKAECNISKAIHHSIYVPCTPKEHVLAPWLMLRQEWKSKKMFKMKSTPIVGKP